ncbi:MAG: type VI secretion system baseplate subunit TssK [Gammaproteobacteria bacterium]|nr:MAG: type VI secretion system baseplate subunit TssK [Gammaproteobacteria bacterium]
MQRLVWAEGQLLSQQHFQAWDALQHEAGHFRLRSVRPFARGFIDLELDELALEGGQLRVARCDAVFPDGRLVSHDAARDGTLSLALDELDQPAVEVRLAIPANNAVQGLPGYPASGVLHAWEAEFRPVRDENDPAREQELVFGRPRLMLLPEGSISEQFSVLPLARLMRQADGGYALDEAFMPPLLRLRASPAMLALLDRLIDMVTARLRSLDRAREQLASGTLRFGPGELTSFLLIQALGSALPALRHARLHGSMHPEELYLLLARTIAALAPFDAGAGVKELPPYDHDRPAEVFAALEQALSALLHTAAPEALKPLELKRESSALLSVEHLDPMQFADTLYLAVKGHGLEPGWVRDFETRVKVGSRQQIELMVMSAVPGARLMHVQNPPAALPVRSGYEYFRIEPSGPSWEQIVEDQSLGIHVGREFSALEIELLNVKE